MPANVRPASSGKLKYARASAPADLTAGAQLVEQIGLAVVVAGFLGRSVGASHWMPQGGEQAIETVLDRTVDQHGGMARNKILGRADPAAINFVAGLDRKFIPARADVPDHRGETLV